MKITIIKKTLDTLALSVDPTIFDDFDADENYNVQINFSDSDSDFDCEYDDCESQTMPSISFFENSPAQSVMTNCLAHYPVINDFVSANR
jgi:hypothetical protein